jgi:hypothetical protein
MSEAYFLNFDVSSMDHMRLDNRVHLNTIEHAKPFNLVTPP